MRRPPIRRAKARTWDYESSRRCVTPGGSTGRPSVPTETIGVADLGAANVS